MSDIQNITAVASLITPNDRSPVGGHIIVDATYVAEGRIYALEVSNGPAHVINEKSAAHLVKQLARDLYEAGHITPGEITDHMLRDTATRTEEEGELNDHYYRAAR